MQRVAAKNANEKAVLDFFETLSTGERADGRPYDNRCAWAFELRGGRIPNVREYTDSLYVAEFFDMIAAGAAA